MSDVIKHLCYTKERTLQWSEKKSPQLSDRTSILVRPIAVARSDADAQMLCPQPTHALSHIKQDTVTRLARRIRLHRYTAAMPVGQQGIAEVLELGPDVVGLAKGQLVIINAKLACGACTSCSVGLSAHCEHYAGEDVYGSLDKPSGHGGLVTDLVCVPYASKSVVSFPESLDPVMLSSIGGDLGEAWCSIEPHISHKKSAVRVLVLGGAARSMSLYVVALTASFQKGVGSKSRVSQLDYYDESDERAGLAELLGATSLTKLPNRTKSGYDLIVSGSVDYTTMQESIDALAVGGTYIQLQPSLRLNGKVSPRIPLTKLYNRSISLITSKPNILMQTRALLDHIEKTGLDISCINTHVADFDQAHEHFHKNTTKVVVKRPRYFSN